MTDRSEDGLPLEGPHWPFIVRFYQRPGVAEACLTLQDRKGVDVIILLFVIYRFATTGAALDTEAIGRLDAAVENWRREVVYPLRAVRRRLKAERATPARAAAGRLRTQVADAGIVAEQIELAMLAVHPAAATAGVSARVEDAIGNALGFYTDLRGLDAQESQALQTILQAARELRP